MCEAMIKQFLTDVVWEDRDYLIIDTPPGTSDEHITVVEQLKKIKLDGAVVVTTPQVGSAPVLGVPVVSVCNPVRSSIGSLVNLGEWFLW